jgi:hypothetical protein
MAQSGVVENLPTAQDFRAAVRYPSVCGACQAGGQRFVSFPRKTLSDRKTRPNARLHVDLASLRKPSAGGVCFFNVMIDQATQYYWIFMHKNEDASAEVVMEAFNGLQ